MDLYTLSIGELSRRTGVGVSTLRAWERRHGFPVAERLPSGHRRYSERDVEAVAGVERERRSGTSLDTALTRARALHGVERSSMYATLASALPHVTGTWMSKRTMLAISRAIEDEAAPRAESPVVIGSFQDARFWRASSRRWQDLAAAADVAAVLASFRGHHRRGHLFEVAVAPGSPVLREWAVVCDSATLSACLVGIERLGARRAEDAERRFEALWTVEPLAVREVARTGFALAGELDPAVEEALGTRLQQPVRANYDSIRVATAITNRIIANLDRW